MQGRQLRPSHLHLLFSPWPAHDQCRNVVMACWTNHCCHFYLFSAFCSSKRQCVASQVCLAGSQYRCGVHMVCKDAGTASSDSRVLATILPEFHTCHVQENSYLSNLVAEFRSMKFRSTLWPRSSLDITLVPMQATVKASTLTGYSRFYTLS
jgi:hypothetical protein